MLGMYSPISKNEQGQSQMRRDQLPATKAIIISDYLPNTPLYKYIQKSDRIFSLFSWSSTFYFPFHNYLTYLYIPGAQRIWGR